MSSADKIKDIITQSFLSADKEELFSIKEKIESVTFGTSSRVDKVCTFYTDITYSFTTNQS